MQITRNQIKNLKRLTYASTTTKNITTFLTPQKSDNRVRKYGAYYVTRKVWQRRYSADNFLFLYWQLSIWNFFYTIRTSLFWSRAIVIEPCWVISEYLQVFFTSKMAVAQSTEFDDWLGKKLTELNTDVDVFRTYIAGILDGEESPEEKASALEDVLSQIIVSSRKTGGKFNV